MQAYRARDPRKSPLWQCAHRHFGAFEELYPEKYQPHYGRLRAIIPEVVHKFLECADLQRGFARIRCDHCEHEYLLAFSCKSRWFCPSCHQKNVQTTADFIVDHVLAAVPHRHYVLAIPRMLRSYFQHHRGLLKKLCALAHESIAEYLRTALECPKGIPAVIMTLHTFGEYLYFHPHIHALVADGLFLRETPATAASVPAEGIPSDSRQQSPARPAFLAMPEMSLKPLEELFRAKIINLLVQEKLLPPERVQVLYSWKHSGFNLDRRSSLAAGLTKRSFELSSKRSPVGIVVLGPARRPVQWNAFRCITRFGVGGASAWFSTLHPEDGDDVAESGKLSTGRGESGSEVTAWFRDPSCSEALLIKWCEARHTW